MADRKDKDMNENRKYGILWNKSLATLATQVWGTATYLGLLFGAMCLAVFYAKGTTRPDVAAAFTGVIMATCVNFIAFCTLEHGFLKRMNEDK
jgi:hypothetical protein